MQHIVVDVEATCWDVPRPRDRKEIIEIGAVCLDGDLEVAEEFDSFVRPVAEPKLSAFCTTLTSITQADVDAADPFSVVFPRFPDWIGEEPYRMCSWGSTTSPSSASTAPATASRSPSRSRTPT